MKKRRAALWLPLVLVIIAIHPGRSPARAQEQDEPSKRRVYVPVEDLDAVLEQDKQGVILSRDEFQKLWNEGRKHREAFPESPHKIVVSRADYSARIHENQLLIEATIELNQLAPGWQTTTLPFRGLAVEAVRLDDKPAHVGRGGGDERPLVVFTREPGRHVLKLQLSAPLLAVGSDKASSFSLAPISSGTLEIELPAGKFLNLDDLALERPAAADQPARYRIAVGGKAALALRITDRQAQQTSASLVFATSAIGLHVAPEERTWRAVTALSVFGKPIDNLTFVVPKALEITAVESTGLERWEIADDPQANATALKLFYRQAFSEPRTVTLSGLTTSVIGQPWNVPTLSLKSATSHLIRVLVQHPAALRLQQLEASGIRRVPADEAPTQEMPGVPDMPVRVDAGQKLFYAAWREDFSLSFVTQPRSRELLATIATRIDVNAREISLRSSIAVHSRFAPLFDFDVALPVDWNMGDVLIDDRPASWRVVPVAAGSHVVRVTFHSPIAADGKVNLTLLARMIPAESWPIEDQTLSFKLPEVTLPQVAVTDGRYMIAAATHLDLVPEDVTGLDPVAITEAEQQAVGAPRLAYEYQDTRFSGTLKVVRKPARISAETLAFYRLDRETLSSHLEARMAVQGGGVQRIQMALPESAGTNLQFALVDPRTTPGDGTPRITQQTSVPAEGARRIWTLELDRRAFGLLWARVDLTAPRPADTAVELPALEVLSADRQDSYIAVEGGPDQELTITAQDSAGQPLADVDPADVPAPQGYAPHERIVAAFRALRPGFRITASELRFEREPVPTAFCDRASLTSVLGEAGEEQHKAEFLLRAIGVQSLRIELPAGADLWATLIDSKPVEVRAPNLGDGESVMRMIPWPHSEQPGAPRRVELFYRTSGKALASSGRLRQLPPRIAAMNGQGNVQPIEILDSAWTLYYPRETEIVSSSGDFDPQEKPARESFLGRLHRSLSLASPNVLWQKLASSLIVGLAIGLFFFAYRRRGVAGAAAVALVGLIAVVIVSFRTINIPGEKQAPLATSLSAPAASSGEGPAGAPSNFWVDRKSKNQYYVGVQHPEAAEEAEHELGRQPVPASRPMAGVPLTTQPAAPFLSGVPPTTKTENTPVLSGGIPAGQALTGAEGTSGTSGTSGMQPGGDKWPRYGDIVGLPSSPVERAQVNGGQNTFGFPLPPFAAQGPAAGGAGGGAPAQQPLPEAAANAEAGGVPLRRSSGALLSLAVDFPVPTDSRQTVFRFSGAASAEAVPTLDIEYQNRRAISFVVIAWQAGVLLLFWFARRWSAGSRAALGILGLLIPLALVPVVPVDLLAYLDGLFLGTIWGLLLWAMIALVGHRKQAPRLSASSPLCIGAFVILAACGFANRLFAQEAKPQAAQEASQNDERVIRAGAPSLIVPYDTDEGPLKAARVLLPWDRFLELWNSAHPEETLDATSPADGLVAEALYSAKLSGDKSTVEARARFALHSFRDEQVELALPLGSIAFEKAELDGKSAPLTTRSTPAGTEQVVVLTSRGAHVLDVTLAIPAERSGEAGKFTLPLKPVAAGSLRFALPAADLNLQITGIAAAFRRTKAGEQAIAIIPVDQGGNVTIAWSPARAREAAQAIVQVESATSVSLGDAGLRIGSEFKYTVRQGTLADVLFSIPDGLLVRRIAGPDVGGWELAGEKNDRTLKVFLRRPVADATVVQLDLFSPQSFGDQSRSIAVPLPAPQQATRETGTLGVYAERQLSATVAEVAGLSQIELSHFVPPAAVVQVVSQPGTAPLVAYRFTSRPVKLQLLVARQKPRSKGAVEHAVFVAARRMRIASRIELDLAGAPRSELTIQLPTGYLLYGLKANAAVDYHVEKRPGGEAGATDTLLFVEFAAPRTGTIELALDGIVPRAPEDAALVIEVPAPVEISELRSNLAVWLDRAYTATLSDFSGWKSIDPAALSDRLRAARPAPVQFAFSSSLTALQPVVMTLDRAEARLSADALAVVIVRETSVQYLLYLRWNISAAGENRFIFTTPDWLADRLEFDRSAGGIRIREVESQKIDGGRLRWTVTLEEPRTNVATVLAQATLPPPESGRIEAPTVVFEQQVTGDGAPRLQKIEPQHEYLVLANQSPDRLEQQAPDAVEAIPAADLPIKIGQKISDQAAEIVRVRDAAAQIGWQAQGAQRLKGLPASVNLARLTLVLARDGSWREQVEYRINNRSRQFLALRLPAGSRILSVFVAGAPSRPISPERADDPNLVLVPLPKTSAGDLSAEVKLVFAGRFDRPLPKGVQVLQSEIDLPAPHVLSQSEDATFGMPVASTEWTVVLPNDVDGRRIDDPERSNVTESEEGAELLLEAYKERLNMFVTALDSTNSMNVRNRAVSNLKQQNLAQFSEVEQRLASGREDDRQVREWRDVQNKVQELERRSMSGKGQADFRAASGNGVNAGVPKFGGFDVQNDLVTENPADFGVNAPANADDLLAFTVTIPAPETAAQSPPEVSDKKSGGGRREELRRETGSQSLRLNAAVAQEQAQRGGEGIDAAPKQPADAEKLLAQTRAPLAAGGGDRRAPVDAVLADGSVVFNAVLGQPITQSGSGNAWSAPGGLSLAIDVPQDGRKLTFSKSGGDARLALGLRPRASLEIAFGLAWAVVCLLIAFWLIAALGRADAWQAFVRRLPLMLAALGLAWFFLLPGGLAGFALFVVGAVAFGWQRRKA